MGLQANGRTGEDELRAKKPKPRNMKEIKSVNKS